MVVPLLIAFVIGYLLGALPFGYLVAKAKGVNIFECGSKNPGATNVRRVLGKGPGNLVFFLDAIKGAVATGWPLLLAHQLAAHPEMKSIALGGLEIVTRESAVLAAVVGLVAALLGHSFSCFTYFRGGKGVATTVGGFLVLMPVVILISSVLWWTIFMISRYVSLASILAALVLPISAYFLGESPTLLWLAVVIALFVTIRHRSNLLRLLNGTENKFVKKPPMAQSTSKQP